MSSCFKKKQSEASKAVCMSIVDDVTFLKLMVGSLVPDDKESGNSVVHFSGGHSGPGWKLFLLHLHGLVWREIIFHREGWSNIANLIISLKSTLKEYYIRCGWFCFPMYIDGDGYFFAEIIGVVICNMIVYF